MKWRGRRSSSNVRSTRGSSGRRSSGVGSGFGGGRGPRIPVGMIGGGGGFIGLIIIVILLLSQGGLRNILPLDDNSGQQAGGPGQSFATDDVGDPVNEAEMEQFLSVALADTEDAWNSIFRDYGYQYKEPTLHIFSDYVQSACGGQSRQVGPFYCPVDETIYIDLTFYTQLRNDFRAGGDFTMAYVLSHEVGHHVQNILGILDDVRAEQRGMSEAQSNAMNVRVELQADYFAGVVARWQEEQGFLAEGDIEEAINAAEAIGDDTIQRRSRGYVVEDSFTHGSAEQRMRWYQRGYQYGDLEHGDTFSIPESQLFDYSDVSDISLRSSPDSLLNNLTLEELINAHDALPSFGSVGLPGFRTTTP